MKKGVIFSDLDGTLIYHDDIHSLKKIRKKSDKTILVRDINLNKNYECYDVSTNLYNVFFAVETRKLLFDLKDDYYIVIISGARKKSVTDRREVLDFADAFLIENGGLVLDSNFKEDEKWNDYLEKGRKDLWIFAKELEKDGWILDKKGRKAGFRVREIDNPKKTKEDIKKIENMKLPKRLKQTSNLGSIDIIIKKAGKDNVVKYFLKKMKLKKKDSIGIGDDVNDIALLKETNKKFVLGNAYPKLKAYAKKKKWYISNGKNFEGIKEILLLIKNL